MKTHLNPNIYAKNALEYITIMTAPQYTNRLDRLLKKFEKKNKHWYYNL